MCDSDTSGQEETTMEMAETAEMAEATKKHNDCSKICA